MSSAASMGRGPKAPKARAEAAAGDLGLEKKAEKGRAPRAL